MTDEEVMAEEDSMRARDRKAALDAEDAGAKFEAFPDERRTPPEFMATMETIETMPVPDIPATTSKYDRLKIGRSETGLTTGSRQRADRAQNIAEESARIQVEEQRRLADAKKLFEQYLPEILRDLKDNILQSDPPAAQLVPVMDENMVAWRPYTAGGGVWSGVVMEFYGDYRYDLGVSDSENIKGKYICYFTGITGDADTYIPPRGISVRESTWSRFSWSDEIPGAPWVCWHVADKSSEPNDEGEYTYNLNNHTAGDIRAPFPILRNKYMVLQQGDGESAGDKGVLGQYPRTH